MLLTNLRAHTSFRGLKRNKRVNENISPFFAITISVLSILGSWLVYDFICKSKLINYKIIFPIVLLIIGTVIAFVLKNGSSKRG